MQRKRWRPSIGDVLVALIVYYYVRYCWQHPPVGTIYSFRLFAVALLLGLIVRDSAK